MFHMVSLSRRLLVSVGIALCVGTGPPVQAFLLPRGPLSSSQTGRGRGQWGHRGRGGMGNFDGDAWGGQGRRDVSVLLDHPGEGGGGGGDGDGPRLQGKTVEGDSSKLLRRVGAIVPLSAACFLNHRGLAGQVGDEDEKSSPARRRRGRSSVPPCGYLGWSGLIRQLFGGNPSLSLYISWLNWFVFILDTTWARGLTSAGAMNSAEIVKGAWWRLITPMFLHANLMHIAVNSSSLMNIGPSFAERMLGPVLFLSTYFVSGVGGAWLSHLRNVGGPAAMQKVFSTVEFAARRSRSPYTQSVGASGAIFGLVGAVVMQLLRLKATGTPQGSTAGVFVSQLTWFAGINFVYGWLIPGIDNYGHLGGLLSGMAMAGLFAPRYAAAPPMHIKERGLTYTPPPRPVKSFFSESLGVVTGGGSPFSLDRGRLAPESGSLSSALLEFEFMERIRGQFDRARGARTERRGSRAGIRISTSAWRRKVKSVGSRVRRFFRPPRVRGVRKGRMLRVVDVPRAGRG